MKRFLITGGAGFIGSHLSEELLRRGHAVTVLDDLSTGRMENLTPVAGDARFHCVIGNVTSLETVAPLVDACDGVFHLAAAVGVQLVFNQPTRTIQTNIRGAEVVLELAARERKKVFMASTSEVYGKGVRIPLAETDDLLLGPTTCARWAYACSKAVDEFLALAYWKERRSPTVIGRFFNTVGPRQTGRYGMVIPRLVQQALAGEPLTIYGDGMQSRCFTHVSDVSRAVADLMEMDASNGEVFNIGSDEEISILELARRIVQITGGQSEVQLIPFEEAFGPGFEDMTRRAPDLTKLRRAILWTQLRNVDQILRDTIEHFQTLPASAAPALAGEV